jgi:hypothetical protein
MVLMFIICSASKPATPCLPSLVSFHDPLPPCPPGLLLADPPAGSTQPLARAKSAALLAGRLLVAALLLMAGCGAEEGAEGGRYG